MRQPPDGTLKTVREVVGWLTRQIHEGVWPPETRLPPERTLAEKLGVHRSTVAASYAELQALGLVDRRRGSGTWVHGDLWGVTTDWTRYLDEAAFRPTGPLVQRFREARTLPGMVDFTQADLGGDLIPLKTLTALLPGLDVSGALAYSPPLGSMALRRAIAHEFARLYHHPVDPDTILITAGAQQALYLITRALLRPGDAIAIEQPSFYYSLSMFQSAGVRLLPIPMDQDGLLPDALVQVLRRHRPAMVLLNPTYHNPTATTLSLERRRAVLDLCQQWNLPLVEDNAFEHLAVANSPSPPPPLKVLDEGHRVIYVGTLSKVVAPGLRIGWLIAPKPVVERLADVKGQMDLGMTGLVQALAAAFLESPIWPDHVHTVQRALRERRDRLVQALCGSVPEEVRISIPDGGLYLWVQALGDWTDRQRLEAAIRCGVVYAPGRVYGSPDGFARLNYAWEDPVRAVQASSRLGAVLSGRAGEIR